MDAKHGEFAVRLARSALDEWVRKGKKIARPKCGGEFLEKSGVFATLHAYPGRELRGCIGFPEPVMPLADAIIEAAISAAQDPRFPPVEAEELEGVLVEVSVLTKPEKISAGRPEEYPKKITIGRDGLIIRRGWQSGLLLPQVPVEYGWDAETFLEHLCMKAALPPGSWKDKETEIFRFRSEIFSEKRPRGRIERC
jgi:uncharacterized protein (TIGR00296 family)